VILLEHICLINADGVDPEDDVLTMQSHFVQGAPEIATN
jgi:hypothetical protein